MSPPGKPYKPCAARRARQEYRRQLGLNPRGRLPKALRASAPPVNNGRSRRPMSPVDLAAEMRAALEQERSRPAGPDEGRP